MSIPGIDRQTEPRAGGPTARGRRWRVGGMTAVLVVAATVSVVILNALAARADLRWDVTRAGEHRLSPRTEAMLARVSGRHEIVVAGPLSDRAAVDAEARRAVLGVLARLSDGSRGQVSITIIDTGAAEGLRRYQDLLARLGEREAAEAGRQVEAVSAAAAEAERLAGSLEGLSSQLLAVREAIPEEPGGAAAANRAYFEQRAAEARVSARALRELADRARQLLAEPMSPLPIPDTEQAAGLLRPAFAEVQAGLAGIAENLGRFAGAEGAPGAARDAARGLAAGAATLRDEAGVARDRLERLPRLDLPRVAGALRGASAVLVVGPAGKGITGVEFASVLPPPSPGAGGMQPDYGRIAEELIGTALAGLVAPARPIVVLMHAQTRAAVERLPFFDAITELLALRGIDVLVWPVAESPEPPATTRLDPQGNRPVVYVVFNTAGFTGGPTGQTGQERVAKLARAIQSLAAAGKPLLLSVMPSNAPTYGEKDPTTAFLSALGVEVDAGRPVLRELLTPEGRRVEAFQRIQPGTAPAEHPILRAVRGLPTRLEWPVPMDLASPPPAGVRLTPLYAASGPGVWAESQWLALFQVPISQHAGVPNPPSPDSARDDAEGPFVLAAAVEREAEGREQRLVVVGANSWFTDPVLREPMAVDGRVAAANPGNAELFEASVYWLAGQDDLIAQSALARAAPVIRPLDHGVLAALRWGAMLGLPALVLALGAAYRAWRG